MLFLPLRRFLHDPRLLSEGHQEKASLEEMREKDAVIEKVHQPEGSCASVGAGKNMFHVGKSVRYEGGTRETKLTQRLEFVEVADQQGIRHAPNACCFLRFSCIVF